METLYRLLLTVEFALAVPVFILLLFVRAPYGKFGRKGWGPEIPASLGWMLMESPAVLLPLFWFLNSPGRTAPAAWGVLGLWELHYLQRTLVYPLLLNRNSRRMPASVAALAFLFNLMNGTVSGYGIYRVLPWEEGPPLFRSAAGAALFLTGFVINLHSDRILRHLRAPGETEYRIPRGGLFRLVSSPHYLGEILEWTGWALLVWTPAGGAFLAFTLANLLPRGLAAHRWYREKFPGYPRERRAVIPFLL